MKKIINTAKAPAPIGPYNQAILIGKTLYTSGQIAINPTSNELVLDNIEAETKQVMENLEKILHSAGVSFSDVAKSTIFLTNLDDFAEVNEVYGSFFQGDFPARETVQVVRLPRNARVEISMIASL